jgi:hypothetical protein
MNSDAWLSYVDSLVWQKHHLDDSSWNTFLRAGSLGIDPEAAITQVAQRIKEAGDYPKQTKLKSQLQRAYAYAGVHAGEVHLPKAPKPVYRPDKLEKVAKKVDPGVTPEWLAARSAFSVWNRTPAGFLHKLYLPGEKVIVFDVFESQGCEVWTHPGLVGNLANLNHLQEGRFSVWFLANPVHGEYVYLDRLKSERNPEGKTRRCKECVTSWRYLVIESDEAPRELWLRALVQLPLPIAAIYDSGKRGVHALVRVDAESKEHWDEIVRVRLLPILVTLGACDDSLTAVRLTRLPNCRRGQTGNMQSLLYLNPQPDYTPIAHRRAYVA